MNKKFIPPNFLTKNLELRLEDNEICIYGNQKGLEMLIDLCNELIQNPEKGHIHLEDYELLTNSSLKGVIAIFK